MHLLSSRLDLTCAAVYTAAMATKTHNLSPAELSKSLIEKGRSYYVPNYKPREMILDRGQGARLWDLNGKEYIDFGAGISVCNLGHGDEDLKAALHAQADKLWHTSNIFFTQPPIELAEFLVNNIGWAERVYFCNSGAEANEAAIKLARKYAADKGRPPERREIVTFTGSFHGRTLATVTATAQPKYQEGFEPLPGGFVYCEHFNDADAMRRCIEDGSCCISDKTCAILVEPVQGEGGVMPADPGFLKYLRELCDELGALLIVDEIQCGLGRTGTFTAHEQDEIQPDVMTLAKALGGGLPIGAMVVGDKAAETLGFGSHGSTFGGNPVMAAVALAAVKKLHDPELLKGVFAKEQKIKERLQEINEKLVLFKEVRGRGLMIGAELLEPHHGKSPEISELARKAGVLALVAGPNVMRLLPPLNISNDEIDEGMSRLEKALTEFASKKKPNFFAKITKLFKS